MTESNGIIGSSRTNLTEAYMHVGPGSITVPYRGRPPLTPMVSLRNSTDVGIAIDARIAAVSLVIAGVRRWRLHRRYVKPRPDIENDTDVDRVRGKRNGRAGNRRRTALDPFNGFMRRASQFRNRGSVVLAAMIGFGTRHSNIARLWRANVGDLLTVDTTGLVGVNALQIRGGADFAENFDVSRG